MAKKLEVAFPVYSQVRGGRENNNTVRVNGNAGQGAGSGLIRSPDQSKGLAIACAAVPGFEACPPELGFDLIRGAFDIGGEGATATHVIRGEYAFDGVY
jgi:hypothetical protein